MRLGTHVARMETMRNFYKILVEKRNQLGDLDIDERISTIEIDLKEIWCEGVD
jgi:hypothetical protein